MTATIARKPLRLADVPALILAGGLGTRLQSAVPDVPKALAPVEGRPFLAYLLDRLAAASLRRIILLTGYGAEQIETALGRSYGPLRLEYSREERPLGTGGAVRRALDRLDGRTLLLLNGDSFCEVDLARFFALHRRRRADLSMVVAKVADASRYGSVRRDVSNRITGYLEKTASAGPGWINAGMYLIERALLKEMPVDQPMSLERDWLPRWLACHRVIGFPTTGAFLDIGTPEAYASAAAFFQARRAGKGPPLQAPQGGEAL